MIVIGIDPGASGGIAWHDSDLLERMHASKMPETVADVAAAIECITNVHGTPFAYVEKVSAMPGQGVSSMFKFGQGFGVLLGALAAFKIPHELVTPAKWQREFGLVFPKKLGLTPTEKKNKHKAKAQQLFPHLKVTHATADALLIAEYGRRLRRAAA